MTVKEIIIPFTGEIITAAIRRSVANYFGRQVREVIKLFSPRPAIIFRLRLEI
ncbi:hypothetical protein [Enterobacter sp. Ap-1006]|uniref:hypothetical protein n=1 Tax=Enterobacter sp. Ap-1006 TaxID=2608345 RepID=UPI001422BA07|nr:hypothetical protein [Enterobacter sp. Ap-1006]